MVICEICKEENMVFVFKIRGRKIYRCKRCGLEKIYPLPSESELRYIYNDSYYDAWGPWQKEEVGKVKKETAKHRLNLIPVFKNEKILDCGCASGYFLEVAKDYGYIPYGFDINISALKIAQEKFSSQQVYFGNIESCPFEKNSFYAIFMSDFLEHVIDPLLTINKAHSLLKPQGYLVITTPDTNSFSHKVMKNYWPHYKIEHLFYFNPQNISLMLKKNGFGIISINRAYKCLTLDYLKSYFQKYPKLGIRLFLKGLVGLLPSRIRFKRIWFYFGEMVVVALKS